MEVMLKKMSSSTALIMPPTAKARKAAQSLRSRMQRAGSQICAECGGRRFDAAKVYAPHAPPSLTSLGFWHIFLPCIAWGPYGNGKSVLVWSVASGAFAQGLSVRR
uniref:Uncharacterized protein n=1 Tax=mine drainage metagenome TaxID=410659 RepID=E6PN48_9ZZZZ